MTADTPEKDNAPKNTPPEANVPETTGNDNAPKEPTKFGKSMSFLRKQFKSAVDITVDTAKDLNSKKELGLLAVAIVAPGALLPYGAYRIKRYNDKKKQTPPANDNAASDVPKVEEAPQPPKKPCKKKAGPKSGPK